MSDAFVPDPDLILKPPPNVSLFNRRIDDYARKHDMQPLRVRQRVLTELIFGVLESAKMKGVIEVYLAKGGMALEIRFGVRARASGDLDVGILAAGRPLIDAFDQVLAIGFADCSFERKKGTVRLENVKTYRCEVKVSYKARPIGTIDVDLNEATHEAVTDIVQTSVLRAIGLPGPLHVPLLDPYAQLAQKLHGGTEPDRADYQNNRYRDIIDVLIIASAPELALDFRHLRNVATAEFRRRAYHSVWPPIFEIPDRWRLQLSREAAAVGFSDVSFADIERRFHAFLAAIEGVAVKPQADYRFLSMTLELSGARPEVLQTAAKEQFEALVNEGFTIINSMPRPGFVDQLLIIMERERPAMPRFQLRLTTTPNVDPDKLELVGDLKNLGAPANAVRVFVIGLESVLTFGSLTSADESKRVIFPYGATQLRRRAPELPAVSVEYLTDGGERVQQVGSLVAEVLAGAIYYTGQGLRPGQPLVTFTKRHDPLEDL